MHKSWPCFTDHIHTQTGVLSHVASNNGDPYIRPPAGTCLPSQGSIHLVGRSRSRFTTDSPSVSRYVLVSSTLVGFATRYYFLSEYCFLRVAVLFLWGALSDERAGLQFAVQSLDDPSRGKPVTVLYWLIWDSPNLEGHFPRFISPRNRVAQLYPRALGSLYFASCGQVKSS
jgi:hypothetical protein